MEQQNQNDQQLQQPTNLTNQEIQKSPVSKSCLIKSPDSKGFQIICDFCRKEPATLSCFICTTAFCQNCMYDKHLQCVGETSKKRLCKTHKNEIQFYSTQDKSLVCAQCLLIGDHRGHPYITLTEYIEQIQKNPSTQKTIEKLQQKIQKLSGQQLNLSECINMLQSYLDKSNQFSQTYESKLNLISQTQNQILETQENPFLIIDAQIQCESIQQEIEENNQEEIQRNNDIFLFDWTMQQFEKNLKKNIDQIQQFYTQSQQSQEKDFIKEENLTSPVEIMLNKEKQIMIASSQSQEIQVTKKIKKNNEDYKLIKSVRTSLEKSSKLQKKDIVNQEAQLIITIPRQISQEIIKENQSIKSNKTNFKKNPKFHQQDNINQEAQIIIPIPRKTPSDTCSDSDTLDYDLAKRNIEFKSSL